MTRKNLAQRDDYNYWERDPIETCPRRCFRHKKALVTFFSGGDSRFLELLETIVGLANLPTWAGNATALAPFFATYTATLRNSPFILAGRLLRSHVV